MSVYIQTAAIAASFAVATASGSIAGLDGTVGYHVHGGSNAGTALLGDSTVSFTDGVGVANFVSISPGLVSGGSVSINVSQVDATTRALTVVVESDDFVDGFFMPGTTIGGDFLNFMGFSLGMDTFGPFPGAQNSAFADPDFNGIISTSGNAFDLSGVEFVAPGNNPIGLFTED